MKRRNFLKTVGMAAAALAIQDEARGAESSDSSSPSRRRQPNIVLLMADDLGYGDLGCYGQQLIETPNIDRLAKEGLLFHQAYAGAPVCTPSRCALMTGLHNGHAAARDNVPHYPTYLEQDDVTVAEMLKKAGYHCGGVGKWSLGDAGTVGRATNKGFDMWLGYLNQDHAHYYYTEYLDDNDGRLELTGNTESRKDYSHDLFVERALTYIRENKDVPFFLYGAFTLPHFSAEDEDPDGLTVPSIEPYDDKDWDVRSKKYAAMIHMLDRDVGRITSLIDELGLTRDTLVIFTSDNGGNDNVPARFDTSGPFRGFKRDLSEGGIRAPFIARWPGVVPMGKTSDEIVAFWDMLPTFAELAGAQPPPHIDGTSITHALRGGNVEKSHEYLYWDYGHCRDRYDQAVRMGKWKGIRLGRESEIQLYDLEKDLGETNNVAAEHAEVITKIESIMNKAVEPNPRYPIGTIYKGSPLWKKEVKGQ
ncbi:MAG: sulfatase-like hydrolase/transferase [Candidatus Hydrogenedentes bacterium]|nr:sulfatase-like hydrolase/transferase [Candidatus Hydrogenedentota bacterium]